ncbi:MAG TPA: hypothetical protein VGA38_00105 [Candidatus Limnocylindria bacterium]
MAEARKRKSTARTTGSADRELKQLARRYKAAMGTAGNAGIDQLKLAKRLKEIAVQSEGAHLMTVEHAPDGKGKPKVTNYALTDPRAAMILLWGWCNIWLPIPALVCIAKGCKPIIPPIPPARVACFLIECAVDVCPAPGAPRFMCIYLCI